MVSTGTATSDRRVATLRGAPAAEVDARRLRAVAAAVCVLALAAATVALFVAGAHKNAQISNLREHGVPITMSVTGCMGLLGGSGSNVAGYACRGTFTLDGRRYDEAIPGNVLRPPGSTVAAVTVPGDPHLVATADQLAAEHPSARVYILPAVLLVILVALVGIVVLRRRARRPRGASPSVVPAS
jgi:hypothetical protein